MTDFATYQGIDAVNWSTLQYAGQSGLAYRHCLTEETPETDAMRLGRAAHAAVFEPETYAAGFVVWEGGRRAGGEWERFKHCHLTRTILRADDVATVEGIGAAVRGHAAAAALLAEGRPEVTLEWTDAPTGIACKARLDWVGPQSFVDLKTTRNIEIRAFGAHAAAMLYHGQMAFYADALKANGMERTCRIIAVESEPPHDVAVFELDEDVLWAGEALYRKALRTVATCRAARLWPGRYPAPVSFVLPAWCHPTEEETDAALAEVGI